MERLTKKDRYGHYYTNEDIHDRMLGGEPYPHAYDGKPIDKLADYEDKQEQWLLLELPVPIGGTVYEIVDKFDFNTNETHRDISTSTVIHIKGNEKNPVILVCEAYCGIKKHFTPSAFGIRAFATRSEAESALAKMGGK